MVPTFPSRRSASSPASPPSGVTSPPIGSVGPTLDAPILDFGALDAKIEIADYHAHELASVYKASILTAVQQVDEANAAYQGFRQSLRSLDLALDRCFSPRKMREIWHFSLASGR